MDWDGLKAAIIAAFKVGPGAEYDVHWRDESVKWRERSHARVSIQSFVRVGRHERRYGEATAEGMPERIIGNRRLTLQVQCETQKQPTEGTAHEIADALTCALECTAACEILEGVNLGRARVQGHRPVEYRDEHGRTRSAVMFEVVCNATSSFDAGNIPFVETVEISGEVDGTELGPITVTDPVA